jgi:hypothetical protein
MAITHNGGTRTSPGRPYFAPNQQLTAQQLNAIIDDELRRQRLLTRALHGSGIVFGYALTDEKGELAIKDHCIDISCGLIIDRHGRDLYWPGGPLCVRDIVNKQPDHDAWYVLQAHYAQRYDPPEGCGPCPSDAVQWIKEKVVFTLSPWCPEANWDCPQLPQDECITLRDYVCGRTGSEPGPVPRADDLKWACSEPGPLCETPCGEWKYDREAGIPIACVWVCDVRPKDVECGPMYGFCPCVPKVCEVRPYVYRTPLLFELARDCHVDLPRVRDLTWKDWLMRDWSCTIPCHQFVARLQSETHGFEICFTKPIAISTLHPASIILVASTLDEDEGFFSKDRRIPLKCIKPLDQPREGYTTRVRLVPFSHCIGEIKSSLREGALIELTIRGQMLRDECGRMLDARPLDIGSKYAGQSCAGGDFVVVFRLQGTPKYEWDADYQPEQDDYANDPYVPAGQNRGDQPGPTEPTAT